MLLTKQNIYEILNADIVLYTTLHNNVYNESRSTDFL
jgi:hypothetical protein